MITIKVVASLNFFGQGNYCTKNSCAMCTGTKADFSQCINQNMFRAYKFDQLHQLENFAFVLSISFFH